MIKLKTHNWMTTEELHAQLAAFTDEHLTELVNDEVKKLCDTGGKSFTMSVPVSKYDTDILFSELLRRFKASRQAAVTPPLPLANCPTCGSQVQISTGKEGTSHFVTVPPALPPFRIVKADKFKRGDFFLWQGRDGVQEIHQYHSDAGYGIKTFTDYSELDESSMLVNWSGVVGKIEIGGNAG